MGRYANQAGESHDQSGHSADDADEHAIRAHYQLDVLIGRAERAEHPNRAQTTLCQHGETRDGDECDEQHDHRDEHNGNGLGVERVALRHRLRCLDICAELLERRPGRVKEHRDLRRRSDLTGRHQGERVEKVLGVLDDANDRSCHPRFVPAASNFQAKLGRDARGQRHLVSTVRKMTRHQ